MTYTDGWVLGQLYGCKLFTSAVTVSYFIWGHIKSRKGPWSHLCRADTGTGWRRWSTPIIHLFLARYRHTSLAGGSDYNWEESSFVEKQVSWRMPSGTGSYWSDGGGGKAARQRVDGPFISSCGKRGFIYSHNNNTIVRRNDRRKWTNARLRREMHYSFFFFSVSSFVPLWLKHWRGGCPAANTWLLTCFSVLGVWVRQNAKSIRPFLPPFPLWCNFKKPMDGPPEALKRRKKEPTVRNKLRMKVQGEKLHPTLLKCC